MRFVWLYFFLLVIINAVVVCGNYIFALGINSITAPTNRTADGSCCACCEEQGICSNPCDIGLRLCLRPAGYDHSDPSCPLRELYGNANPRITYLAITGPWHGAIQLYIRATHSVGSPDQQTDLIDDLLIDNLFIEVGNFTPFSPFTAMEVFMGNTGQLEADLQFRVRCDIDLYGPNCEVECHGQDDEEGHYFCNDNGDRECLTGYQNLMSNCTECAVADGCMNGYCDAPLNCLCMDGWSGDLCNDCIPSESCSPTGGYCMAPGECLCRNGYAGDDCNITITPTPSVMTPSLALTVSSPPVPVSVPSLTANDHTTITKPLIQTVGGLVPLSESSGNPSHKYIPILVVAAVGGLLLLLILIIGIVAVAVQKHPSFTEFRRRGLFNSRRLYEVSTSGSGVNGHVHDDDNRLVNSTTPTCQQNDANMTFATFRNGTFSLEQPQQRELHVYHHHNTPEPLSVLERDRNEEEGRVESVEMEFPSGYTDDPWPDGTIESYLQWSSGPSYRCDHLNKNGRDGEIGIESRASFNNYQID